MHGSTITIFTLDRPSFDGPGKSTRMMHWLAHLSSQYLYVNCIFLSKEPIHEDSGRNSFNNVSWISIPVILPCRLQSLWRRLIVGWFMPLRYNLSWVGELSIENISLIETIIHKSDVLLFFRLYTYPLYDLFKKVVPTQCVIHLDLDDAEGDTHRQIMKLQWKNRLFKKYIQTRIAYAFILYYEKRVPQDFDTIYCSNPLDLAELKHQFLNTKIVLFPNKVRHRPFTLKPDYQKNFFTLLFTGALNYFPNEDAIEYLITEIWPLIKTAMPQAKLIVAGSKPSKKIMTLTSSTMDITLIPNPDSMVSIFEQASILIVPLRVGGGTRIKILEAFSYGIPVVSTTVGMSGILIEDREGDFISNEALSLSNACISLMKDSNRYVSQAQNAYKYYLKHHAYDINYVA